MFPHSMYSSWGACKQHAIMPANPRKAPLDAVKRVAAHEQQHTLCLASSGAVGMSMETCSSLCCCDRVAAFHYLSVRRP